MLRRACSAVLVPVVLLLVAVAASPAAAGSNSYHVTKLVSDQAGEAANTDSNLVNAWGLAAGPTTPWWVADNETKVSTLYDGSGNGFPSTGPLVVDVPGAPTGLVFNGGSGFVVSDGTNSGPAKFLFATEAGTIRGWSPAVPPPPLSTQTEVGKDRSGVGAIYKGLAIASTPDGDRLYAADFHNGRVDVFDSDFGLVTSPGAFVDPTLPARFAPFGIQAIGDAIFVAYAKQDADREDEVAGRGLGFVDMYDTSGNILGRVATRGLLNAPWGLAIAPATFGRFGGDLLVGNFGDGQINAFVQRPNGRFEHDGRLRRPNGLPLAIDGLWALQVGNDNAAGSSNSVFFTAGPDDETHGLFGRIDPAS
ncbi:MAG: TIGR03118 family protein [Actinomycetota bacterium]